MPSGQDQEMHCSNADIFYNGTNNARQVRRKL